MTPHVTTAETHSRTPELALAMRRARRRAHGGEAGAVVFIVAMTIAVLVSLGIFALVSASTEIKSAGYERQAMQTHYLAEFGMVAAAQKVGPDYAQAVEAQMRTTSDYNGSYLRHHCISLEAVPTTADAPSRECKILRSSDLTQGWGLATPLRPSSLTVPGSLGAVALNGDFSVEISDPVFGQPVAGMANIGQGQQSMCPVTFTVAAYGIVTPNNAGSNLTQLYGSASAEEGRGRLTGGPIVCPQ